MEDEELEEKKVDTQTTTDNADKADKADSTEKEAENTNQEENQEEGQEQERKADDEQDDKISKAFGNKSESKNEGGKSKKNTVAKTNDDGSITFKNQEELNGFIDRMFAKGARKAEKEGSETQSKEQGKQGNQENQQSEEETQETVVPKQNFTADIALALIEADINPKKARRAANLVDMNKVIVDGQLDEAKLKEEIDAITTDFPELKVSASESKELQGFKFGAGQQENTDNNSNDVIASIFGNKK